jgi:molybdate transport system regulatory protein
MSRAPVVTNTDVALLKALARQPSVVEASRQVGISRDRAVYRISRLARAFGGPVVTGTRGGRGGGATRLTPLGDRIVRGGFDSVELIAGRTPGPATSPNLLRGIYHRDPSPEVVVGRSFSLTVAFGAADGERVAVSLDPENVILARERFRSSARNVIEGVVERIRAVPGEPSLRVGVRCVGARLRVSVMPESVRELGLKRGTRVLLYVKATALRRVGLPTRGSPRS